MVQVVTEFTRRAQPDRLHGSPSAYFALKLRIPGVVMNRSCYAEEVTREVERRELPLVGFSNRHCGASDQESRLVRFAGRAVSAVAASKRLLTSGSVQPGYHTRATGRTSAPPYPI